MNEEGFSLNTLILERELFESEGERDDVFVKNKIVHTSIC